MKIVSAEKGPSILTFDFFRIFTAGETIFLSSLNMSLLSQCGFSPVIAILGFSLNFVFQNFSIILIFFTIFDLDIFFETNFNGS